MGLRSTPMKGGSKAFSRAVEGPALPSMRCPWLGVPTREPRGLGDSWLSHSPARGDSRNSLAEPPSRRPRLLGRAESSAIPHPRSAAADGLRLEGGWIR